MTDTWSAPLPYHAVEELAVAYSNRVAGLPEATTTQPSYVMGGVFLVAVLLVWGVIIVRLRARRARMARSDKYPTAQPSDPDIQITKREREILELISAGNSTKEIAKTLGISPKTVEFHRANLLKKYGARTSSQLVAMAT